MRKLGELVTRVETHGPDPAAETFTYVDLSSVSAESKSIVEPRKLAFAEAPSRARQKVSAHDVLVSTVRPNLNGVAMVPDELDGAIASTGFCVLRSKQDELHPRYLFHWVRSDVFVKSMTWLATGASYPAVSDSIVKGSSIPLPPLPDQRRIADILDRADDLRAQRRRALESLAAILSSLFVETFGNPVPTESVWPVVKIGDLLVSANYGTSKKADATGKWPTLGMGNLSSNGEIDASKVKFTNLSASEESKFLVAAGDILFNRTNSVDLVGKTAVFRAETPMAFAGYLVRLRTDLSKANPEFIAGFLNSAYGKARLRGMAKSIVGMANINAQEVKSIDIPHPPKALQDAFASRVSEIEQTKALHRQHLQMLDELFASLQNRAFSGML